METATIISLLIAIFGTIIGSAGLILSILNYFNDRPNVKVILMWDMKPFGSATEILNENKLWGSVAITNIGRRPIYVSHLHLDVPNYSESTWLLAESINGEKLQEGDPPKIYPLSQEKLEQFCDRWDKIRAVVIDSTGKKYYSKPANKKPSWAGGLGKD